MRAPHPTIQSQACPTQRLVRGEVRKPQALNMGGAVSAIEAHASHRNLLKALRPEYAVTCKKQLLMAQRQREHLTTHSARNLSSSTRGVNLPIILCSPKPPERTGRCTTSLSCECGQQRQRDRELGASFFEMYLGQKAGTR